MATTNLPTHSTFIDALHKNCLVSQKDNLLTPPEDTCPICYSQYATTWINYHPDGTSLPPAKHLATQMPCGHFFGYSCIRKWLQQSSSQCPLCRAVFFAPGERAGAAVPERSEGVVEVDRPGTVSEVGWESEEENSEWESDSEDGGEDGGEGEEYADEDLRGDWFGLDVYGRGGDGEGEDGGVHAAYDRALTIGNFMSGQALRGEGGEGDNAAETSVDIAASQAEASTSKGSKDIAACITGPYAVTISVSSSEVAIHEHNAKITDNTTIPTSSVPPLHLSDAELDNHADAVPSWSMNGGTLLNG
jgi:hypothetical protein